jgi:hypothetical protein
MYRPISHFFQRSNSFNKWILSGHNYPKLVHLGACMSFQAPLQSLFQVIPGF